MKYRIQSILAFVGIFLSSCASEDIPSDMDATHSERQKIDYVDEYGINHGLGVEIDGVVWAPVNCGYHEHDFKYGKLYQWGRKYGQGYDGDLYDVDWNNLGDYSDTFIPELVSGPVSLAIGQSKDYENKFYYNSLYPNWCEAQDDSLWNSGTEDNPVKTEYDPCPAGWRVPTRAEFQGLIANYSSWTTDENNQPGHWFSGTSSYTEAIPQIFFPAAGTRSLYTGIASLRGYYGDYWSSKPYDNHAHFDNRAYFLSFSKSGLRINNDFRSSGHSVRCVQE